VTTPAFVRALAAGSRPPCRWPCPRDRNHLR
jgi:hypothetical protein